MLLSQNLGPETNAAKNDGPRHQAKFTIRRLYLPSQGSISAMFYDMVHEPGPWVRLWNGLATASRSIANTQ